MTIDEAIEKKEKLILEWTNELEMTPDNELIHLNHCKEIIKNYKQEIEWLEELKEYRADTNNMIKQRIADFAEQLKGSKEQIKIDF